MRAAALNLVGGRLSRSLASVLLICGLGAANPVLCDEKPVLTWAAIELPPITMFRVNSPDSLADLGEGSTDIATRAITAHLPGYQHKIVSASVNRIISDMAAGKPLCLAAALRAPETEKVAYFTSRGITPPNHLVVRRKDVERITQGARSVSLAKLLLRQDIFGMIGAKRPLGPGIDELTVKPQKQLKQVPYTHFTTLYSSLMRSIDTGQTDYTIELPYVVEYYNRQAIFFNELVAIPLEEAAEPETVYVACTRSPWGARMIVEMDTAIRAAIREDRGIRNALLHWLPTNLQGEYTSRLDVYFKNRLLEASPKTD